MKHNTRRVSDYLDEPKGAWKYLMTESGSDYVTACSSLNQVRFNQEYGRERLGKKYHITKISVWPHRKFKKEMWIHQAQRLAGIISGTIPGTSKDISELAVYLVKNEY